MRLSNKYGGLQFFAAEVQPEIWVLNDVVYPGLPRTDIAVICSGVVYPFIKFDTDSGDDGLYYAATLVFNHEERYWIDNKYKVISFGTTPTGDLLTWLQANGTKQGGASTMSKSYDLSTSTKWANLADGEHVVKLKSKGAGYGTSSFSNEVTVTKGVVMPVKGDLITIESKQYRVLKTNGSVAEVLAMYDASTSQAFGSNNTYAGSALDTYCNSTFYSGLSAAIKSAVVDKTFAQDSWYYGSNSSAIIQYNGTYQTTSDYVVSLMSTTYGTNISRKCYVLSCQDVIDYLEVTTSMSSTDTTLTSDNVWKMFWNQTTSPGSSYVWLRSAYFGKSDNAFFISCLRGRLDYYTVTTTNLVRPAFQIDLSKIEWSPVGGG